MTKKDNVIYLNNDLLEKRELKLQREWIKRIDKMKKINALRQPKVKLRKAA